MNSHIAEALLVEPVWAMVQDMHGPRTWQSGAMSGTFLWLVLEGGITVQQAGVVACARAGDICFGPLPAGRTLLVESRARWQSVGLRLSLFGANDFLDQYRLPIRTEADEATRLRMLGWMEDLHSVWGQDTTAAHIIRSGIARALFGAALDLIEAEQGPCIVAPGTMSRVLQILKDDCRLSIAELAHRAGYSPAQFRREIRRLTGKSPHAFVTNYRLAEAQRRLTSGNDIIAAIAVDLGFESLSHFTQRFREAYGAPPARYRAMRQSGELER